MVHKPPPPFHRRFNIPLDRKTAEAHFANRVLNFICLYYPTLEDASFPSVKDTSRNYKLRAIANSFGYQFVETYIFTDYVQGDFLRCLQALEALYHALSDSLAAEFSHQLEPILSQSETDLGIRWRNGTFFPSGAKLLDQALVDENLQWLSESRYQNVLAPFQKGLSDFLQGQRDPNKLIDVVRDMYEALEAMAKVITGKSRRDLSKTHELFVKKLSLSDHYKKMLTDYIAYGCQFRHGLEAAKTRIPPPLQEVEAFIYITGLFLRLAIESTTK